MALRRIRHQPILACLFASVTLLMLQRQELSNKDLYFALNTFSPLHTSREQAPGFISGVNSTDFHLREAGCVRKEFLGDLEYGGWTICYPKNGLGGAVVFTIGVGRNILWDEEVIRKYRTVHHGWDPTPTAKDFFSKKAPPQGFIFHKLGLGVKDGTTSVKLPGK